MAETPPPYDLTKTVPVDWNTVSEKWETLKLSDGAKLKGRLVVTGFRRSETHIYRLLYKASSRRFQGRSISILHRRRRRRTLKKAREILEHLPEGFNIVALDESFFYYDSLIRKVWREAGKRPLAPTSTHAYSVRYS